MMQFVKISTSTDAGFGDSEACVLDASRERRNCGMGSRTAQTARRQFNTVIFQYIVGSFSFTPSMLVGKKKKIHNISH